MTLSVLIPLLGLRLPIYMMKGLKVVTKDLPALRSADLAYASPIQPTGWRVECVSGQELQHGLSAFPNFPVVSLQAVRGG